MQGLAEEPFTLRYVIPLFKNKGLKGVEYTHGVDEFGRDVYFYNIDPFGNRRDMAAQVKIGDIGGTNAVQELINQARAAFTNPYYDLTTNDERRVCELYVITSGDFTTNAKTQISNGLRDYGAIHFLNGTKVLEETNRVHFEVLNYSVWEGKMRQLGLDALLCDLEFKNHINNSLELLMNGMKASPLQAIDELPSLLLAFERANEILRGVEVREKDCILHWYSVLIMIRAYHVYGRDAKFGIE
jgi:hypothetical protein